MFLKNIFAKKILIIILLIISAEIISFFGYFFPIINLAGFFIICIITLILSIYKLEYGIYLLLAELFIGSKGYLLFFDYNGLTISIRIALWLIIMSVWLGQTLAKYIQTKKLEINFLRSKYFYYYIILFLFIGWGLASGILNRNSLNNIFFDFNGWLYLVLIFPIYQVFANEENLKALAKIFLACIFWLSIKTILVFYVFSHDFGNFILPLYNWIRTSGVGEITQVQGGFYRIFFQSQIFILLGIFFIFLFLNNGLNKNFLKKSKFWLLLFAVCLLLTAIIISMSRSFWLGLIIGILFLWLILLIKIKTNLKQFIILNSCLLAGFVISLLFIVSILYLPYPQPLGGFNTTQLLADRAEQITGEAGASSRWSLLPELWSSIKKQPILGLGFGTLVTYKTQDPRILETSPDGFYTTYAFEWGWLDIWLKLGIFGLLTYIILLIKMISDAIKINNNYIYSSGVAMGLLILMVVSIFSPYTNHPLGIGFLIISMGLLDYFKKQMYIKSYTQN